MDGITLYKAGKLGEAIEAVSARLREEPGDAAGRTFLFELLSFSGEYDRAEKHLDVVARSSSDAEMGAWMYRTALHAEKLRQEMFDTDTLPATHPAPQPAAGTLNGEAFESLTDTDPRIGARLEVFAAGQYTWIPFSQLESVKADAPARLRDMLWIPARVKVSESFTGMELGEVMVPALTPGTFRHPDDQVRLGRMNDWQESDDGAAVPMGQKMLLVDGEEFPLLELRELRIEAASAPEG